MVAEQKAFDDQEAVRQAKWRVYKEPVIKKLNNTRANKTKEAGSAVMRTYYICMCVLAFANDLLTRFFSFLPVNRL